MNSERSACPITVKVAARLCIMMHNDRHARIYFGLAPALRWGSWSPLLNRAITDGHVEEGQQRQSPLLWIPRGRAWDLRKLWKCGR